MYSFLVRLSGNKGISARSAWKNIPAIPARAPPLRNPGAGRFRVTAQPGAGDRMPFGNRPEQERAPDRAGTGEFGGMGGTGKGSVTPEPERLP
ncbi:MAG: hypothetical protein WC593_07325 [Methanoregula sp.]